MGLREQLSKPAVGGSVAGGAVLLAILFYVFFGDSGVPEARPTLHQDYYYEILPKLSEMTKAKMTDIRRTNTSVPPAPVIRTPHCAPGKFTVAPTFEPVTVAEVTVATHCSARSVTP